MKFDNDDLGIPTSRDHQNSVAAWLRLMMCSFSVWQFTLLCLFVIYSSKGLVLGASKRAADVDKDAIWFEVPPPTPPPKTTPKVKTTTDSSNTDSESSEELDNRFYPRPIPDKDAFVYNPDSRPKSTSPPPKVICSESQFTSHSAQRHCKNDIVFFDDFNKLDRQKWKPEIKIASKPDYEFTVYGDSYEHLSTRSGSLYIEPSIKDENFVENKPDAFDRNSCTGNASIGECSKDPAKLILPPIQSARITTKHNFIFKYGVIDIEAKLAMGDWVLSEIWLLPAKNTYGPFYQSGKIRLMSRGNSNLRFKNQKEMGCEAVEGSVMVGIENKIKMRSVLFRDREGCQRDKFRNFRIIWTPNDIVFVVDGKGGSIMQSSKGKRLSSLFDLSSSERGIWSAGSTMAPFDQEFYISLGVSAGGIRDFEDGTEMKPWNNSDPKAMYKFWRDKDEWKSTWRADTSLVVKSIKVTALPETVVGWPDNLADLLTRYEP